MANVPKQIPGHFAHQGEVRVMNWQWALASPRALPKTGWFFASAAPGKAGRRRRLSPALPPAGRNDRRSNVGCQG